MSSTPPPASIDPYAPAPRFWEQHSDYVAAAAVFITSVLLGVASFPPYHAPSFAYAMLVPGILWAYRGPSLRLYAGTMFAAQAVTWTILLAWLHHVTWVGLLLLGPVVGAWVGVWYLAARWALPQVIGKPALTRLIVLVALAGLWVVIEWSRTWLLSGFPWLPLAASQWEQSSILQIAAYTGAGGISFVLVAMNLGFSAMAHSLFMEGQGGWNFRRPEFLLALFLLLGCLCVHIQETFNRRQFTVPLGRVSFVQPYIPQDVKWDPKKGPGILEILQQTTVTAGATHPDLILWPEASTPWAVKGGDPKVQSFVEFLAQRTRAPLLLGSIAIENRDQPGEAWYNAAFAVDPVAGVQHAYYAKRHLVPFGEYIPWRPVLGWLTKFVPIGDDFTPGPDSSPLTLSVRGNPLNAGVLICYEDVFPELARESVRAGSDFLAVLTNNAWYGEGGAASQHAAHSVLRAVETRRPVLRCGNGGWSGWIDEFGVIRATAESEAGSVYFRGARTFDISRDIRWVGRESFFVQHGDWFVGVCGAAMLLGLGVLRVGAMKPPARPAE